MNPIEELKVKIEDRFPDALIELDPAETDTGGWFLDIKRGQRSLTVEWRSNLGFAISNQQREESKYFGAGHDEVVSDISEAYNRVCELL